jgi:hypothetical protein
VNFAIELVVKVCHPKVVSGGERRTNVEALLLLLLRSLKGVLRRNVTFVIELSVSFCRLKVVGGGERRTNVEEPKIKHVSIFKYSRQSSIVFLLVLDTVSN